MQLSATVACHKLFHFLSISLLLSLIASANVLCPKCLAYNRAPFGTAHAPALWQFVPMNNDNSNNNNNRRDTTTYSHFRHVTFFEMPRKDDNFISELAAFYETSAAKWRRKRQVCSTSWCCLPFSSPLASFYFSLATLPNLPPLPLLLPAGNALESAHGFPAWHTSLNCTRTRTYHHVHLPPPPSRDLLKCCNNCKWPNPIECL